ncbi:EamA family transporter [Vibrio nitrifigilis]|uniref:EamA family transporter n=1 Tax=Vibrio nitrifigilis TaxID=2789781 RepID=A0ABS0GL22_9VIBR|nr:EamA family transporter [Vibrio nitrifigilis]MBF9003127.1 EamA family transporter [Vibrio nitrifigilis]
MSLRDKLLALAIVIAWGMNFVVIKVGLQGMPPLLLAGLRFAFVVFPAIFFVKRPHLPLKWLVIYGLTINFGQFALLFWAIKIGLSVGLASLILQAQAFITVVLGALLLKERIRLHNIVAIMVAAMGIYLLASSQSQSTGSITWFTLVLILGAATSWALGNLTNKIIMSKHQVPTMSLVVWSAIVPTFAFAISSLLFEGTPVIFEAIVHIEWHNIWALFYLSFIATIVGYGGWSYLLSRYETSLVAPLSLLVPVFGLLSAWLLLGETLNTHQIIGVIIIAIGLVFNIFGGRWLKNKRLISEVNS